ncbi:hypothetical protein PLEOSDRAFT_1048502 [Pleurotus ostreatus PC15]|uniref:Vacuolar protein-sorting-associated protein 36 n=1 Tax=Pleurotus ostreatus (strain PC15) TaxID=1137138 RepID=A0A067N9N9_PLEO1|nr:hypothetical protein PLEOSDRAFT_1048502 [Pleurotus ostreatus PC15]
MALRRYTRSVDGTIPVQALLYDDEELVAVQDSVGIYDGSQKSPEHQSGTIHLSTHRLFYIDSQQEATQSFALDLAYVTQTDHYGGLFSSSPKATLYLTAPSSSDNLGLGTITTAVPAFESWECEVCAYRNPPGLSPSAARICSLCGVPRSAVPAPEPRATSLPSSPPVSGTTTPVSHDPTMSIACPACTFLNHPSLSVCEICSTPLPRVKHSSERSFSAKSAPASRPRSPDDETVPRMIKISFRKGGDKAFYSALKRSLKGKAWENNERGTPSERHATTRSGINGILRVVESSAQNRENDLQDSLQDLEALMNKAKEMVRLAADLNEKLTASASSGPSASPLNTSINSDSSALVPVTEPEEATFIRSSLAQLGLQMANTPVTLDMMKDDRKWFDELARELAGILQGSSRSGNGSTGTGLLGERGILPLDEVWGGWNRARGVALIPPSTFLQVIPLLSSYTDPPIRRRTFASGLSVLHTPPFTDAAFAARLSGLLALSGPKTTIEVAQEEKMAVGLATEMIDAVEQGGYICRDDAQAKISGGSGGGAELRWWANIFEGYSWDGQSDISQA